MITRYLVKAFISRLKKRILDNKLSYSINFDTLEKYGIADIIIDERGEVHLILN